MVTILGGGIQVNGCEECWVKRERNSDQEEEGRSEGEVSFISVPAN